MKKPILLTFIIFFTQLSYSQTTREFTEDFETSNGIYGYVEILTQPTTYGFASIKIQAKRIVVQGIKTVDEEYYGNELSEYGINFPFDCTNCYFLAKGEATLYLEAPRGAANGYTAEAGFNKSGSIHLNKYTSHTANFNEIDVIRHNILRKEKGYSVWEKRGYVSYIKISGVAGGDFGRITGAVNQLKRKEKQLKEQELKEEELKEEELKEEYTKPEILLKENKSESTNSSSNTSNSSNIAEKEVKSIYDTPIANQLREERSSLRSESKELRNRTDITLKEKLAIQNSINIERSQNASEAYEEGQRVREEEYKKNRSKEQASIDNNTAIARALIDLVPESDSGSMSLLYYQGQWSNTIGLEYSFIYENNDLGIGFGYNLGFGFGSANSEYKNRLIPGFWTDNIDILQGSAGLSVGNPSKFAVLNGMNFKLVYRNYSILFYDENMDYLEYPEETNLSRYKEFNGELLRGNTFSIGVDLVLLKYLKAGVLIPINPTTFKEISDDDGNSTEYYDTVEQEFVNYNSIFTKKITYYFGIVIPF